jgi:hypothetical protein
VTLKWTLTFPGEAAVPVIDGWSTVSCIVQFGVEVAEAQAGVAAPEENPQTISAAIETNESNKRLLRNIIILLVMSLGTGALGNQYCESHRPISLCAGWIKLSNVIAERGRSAFSSLRPLLAQCAKTCRHYFHPPLN